MVPLKSPQQFARFAVTLVKIFKFETLCKDTPIDGIFLGSLRSVPVFKTSLYSTQTLVTPDDNWMSKSWSKKPPKSTEGENVMTCLTKGLAKNQNFSNLKPLCMFSDKL
jgi:hypothetical protein